MWKYEHEAREAGLLPVCGCDEAGAGPLAGRVYAAAVILPLDVRLPGLNDSKQLTEKAREALFPLIRESAVAWAVVWVDEKEIDRIDILNSRIKAMQSAIDALSVKPALALIDGNRDRGSQCAITAEHRTLIKGDSLSASIAAASILAKVSRDRYMTEMDKLYPGYGFAGNKGYGTKAHFAALDRLGPCPIHRKSFLRKWREGKPQ